MRDWQTWKGARTGTKIQHTTLVLFYVSWFKRLRHCWAPQCHRSFLTLVTVLCLCFSLRSVWFSDRHLPLVRQNLRQRLNYSDSESVSVVRQTRKLLFVCWCTKTNQTVGESVSWHVTCRIFLSAVELLIVISQRSCVAKNITENKQLNGSLDCFLFLIVRPPVLFFKTGVTVAVKAANFQGSDHVSSMPRVAMWSRSSCSGGLSQDKADIHRIRHFKVNAKWKIDSWTTYYLSTEWGI